VGSHVPCTAACFLCLKAGVHQPGSSYNCLPLKALLAYLDAEAPRLSGQQSTSQLAVTAAAAAAAAAAEARERVGQAGARHDANGGDGGDGSGLPPRLPAAAAPKKRRGLFASVQKLFASEPSSPKAIDRETRRMREPQLQQHQQLSRASSFSSTSQAQSEEEAGTAEQRQQGGAARSSDSAQLWADLARVRWCPVLRQPPAPGLPWPTAAGPAAGSGAAGQDAPLAAPVTCRPASDAWLASASCGLVDGAPRSPALLARLGWSRPLPGALLGAQLAALGALHSSPVGADTARVLAEQVGVRTVCRASHDICSLASFAACLMPVSAGCLNPRLIMT
jgi:hypothetical protein